MRHTLTSTNAYQFSIQVILLLIIPAFSPCNLVAQIQPPSSPRDVLREFRKIDSEGGRLTTEGWYRAARFFVKPTPPPRYWILKVILNESMGADSAIHGDRTQVWISLDELGQIDSEGRFTTMVTPSLLAPSGELRSKPWGQEQHGPASFQAVYEFALTNTHWEFTPNHGELREVRGAPEWRIEGALVIPTVTVQTAIRYLTRLHDESSSSVIRRNAKKSIADIQRLVNREKSNAKP